MILQQLKLETHPQHKALEDRLDLLRNDLSLDEYITLLSRFYGFYAPLESRLLARPEWQDATFNVQERHKIGWLQHDLHELGFREEQIARLPHCDDLPPHESFAHVLGCLYVLEGATLGGQIISRHLARILPGESAAFFRAYGEHTGVRWRAFGEFLTARAQSENREEIVAAARATFEKLDVWLQVGAAGKNLKHVEA